MKTENVVKEKSFLFAIRVVNLYKQLSDHRKEFTISKQLLRSGTSVGANVKEAINAQSKRDFLCKLSIAQKECGESIYWLELLKATGYLDDKEFNSIYPDAIEVMKIICSITNTIKKQLLSKS